MLINRQYRTNRYKSQPGMQNLIKELLRVWCAKQVTQNYQNYFLSYLDTLPSHLVQSEISQEIKLSLENKSHYFKINKLLEAHDNVLQRLQEKVTYLQNRQDVNQEDIKSVCELMRELRESNRLVAEATLSFNYKCLSMGKYQRSLIQGNNHIFNKLNSDNEFLKSSLLRKYIAFSASYDPFFLHHYETVTKGRDAKYKRMDCVDQLFDLPISLTYKLMKSQQQILEFLCGRVPYALNSNSHKNSIFLGQEDTYTDPYIQRLQRDSYGKSELLYRQSPERHYRMVRAYTDVPQENEDVRKTENRLNHKPSFLHLKDTQIQSKKARYHLPLLSDSNTPLMRGRNRSLALAYTSTKASGNSDVHRYMFKIRRPHVRRLEYSASQVSPRKRSENLSNPIRIIQQKDQQFKRHLPRKAVKQLNTQMDKNSEYQQIYNYPESDESPKDEVSQKNIQTVNEYDSSRQKPLDKKRYIQCSVNTTPLKVEKDSLVQRSVIASSASTLRNFKLKAGNLKISNIFGFLRELQIKQEYRRVFQVGNWQSSIQNNQYYLHKFYLNQVLYAVSLCCALPESDVLIKYWGPLDRCDTHRSSLLFRKYLEYIERNSLSKSIFYNAVEISEIVENGFTKQRDRIYARLRRNDSEVDAFNYYPFLSVNFSNISVAKTTNKDALFELVVHTYDAYPFNENQFICMNYLLMINKLQMPGSFSSLCSFTAGLRSTKEVRTKLMKQELSESPYEQNSPVSPINLMTFRMRNPLFSAFFIADKHHIKLSGEEIFQNQDRVVASLQLLKHNSVMYFAKGFKSIAEVVTLLKNHKKSRRKIEYSVRMFRKHLRGRILSIHLKDEFCFGDLQFVFEWRDFLKGKILNDISDLQTFGYGCFHCVLEVDREIIFGFDVTEDNFL